MKSSNEPSDEELISNFNKIQLRCIGCGTEVMSRGERIPNKEKEDTLVCTGYHEVTQSNFEPQ